ncbi:MAG: helix-turn-helix domain-containing protein [Sphingomonadales bacterium]
MVTAWAPSMNKTLNLKPGHALDGLETDGDGRESQAVTTIRIGAKATLFFEGDRIRDLLEVVDGTVKLFKAMADGRRQIVGFYFPGGVIGVTADGIFHYDAETVTDVILRRYSRLGLNRAMKNDPMIGKLLFQLTSTELAMTHRHMLLLGRKNPVEKVSTFLLDLARRQSQILEPGHMLDLPMGRGDIADYLGLTIETVSRTISRLRKAHIIGLVHANLVVLKDPARLSAWAEGRDPCRPGACGHRGR